MQLLFIHSKNNNQPIGKIFKKTKLYMDYQIAQMNNMKVKARTPLIALRKGVRRFLQLYKGNKFGLSCEPLTIIDLQTGKEINYIFSIVKLKEQRSIYSKFDYNIQVYKQLALL